MEIWRQIGQQFNLMEQHAPEGYAARVEFHLHGFAEVLPVVLVESRSSSSWIVLHVYGEMVDEPGPEDRLFFVREEMVARVDLRYVPKSERTVGFRVDTASGDGA